MSSQIPVDGEALRTDVLRNASFGAVEAEAGRGRTVLPADEANGRARDYLVDRMEAAGLDVRVDAVGNVAGRWTPPGTDPDVPAVAAGSHLDSVPRGGIFDGALGVYAALESVRAIQASTLTPERPLEVVCFTGEEGTRFADGVLGSSVATGRTDVEAALALSDGDRTLGESLEAIGYRGTGRLDAGRWDAWIELHIEQGGTLEDSDIPVGIVTDITGTTRGEVRIGGEADHAGTTSMAGRRDALAAASELISGVEATATDLADAGSGTAVGTVGDIDVEPNVVNVVPGEVSMRVDLRSTDHRELQTQMHRLKQTLARIEAERDVETAVEFTYEIPPTALSERVRETARRAADHCGVASTRLHSGGGHDTMRVADVTDAGLLFVPTKGGHSHCPRERAAWSDCVTATTVLARSLALLATEGEIP